MRCFGRYSSLPRQIHSSTLHDTCLPPSTLREILSTVGLSQQFFQNLCQVE